MATLDFSKDGRASAHCHFVSSTHVWHMRSELTLTCRRRPLPPWPVTRGGLHNTKEGIEASGSMGWTSREPSIDTKHQFCRSGMIVDAKLL